MPFARTFAPFVAGVAHMHPGRFAFFNVTGAILWVGISCGGGAARYVRPPDVRRRLRVGVPGRWYYCEAVMKTLHPDVARPAGVAPAATA